MLAYAPVIFNLDAAYTERYMGLLEENFMGYQVSFTKKKVPLRNHR